MEIPYIYHPFIAGPNQETAQSIASQFKVKVNIPPPSIHKDEVTISGDKDGVALAKEAIMKIYKEKVRGLTRKQIIFFSFERTCEIVEWLIKCAFK